ncbi:segregation and condensation protein A [Spiroplasma clarkii]|uniref:Segregation and condensation protein A n=1 Tax=Spiroplasma clarkii TaxID=2139 RepID=A0A1Y0L252_9MOLU|nr:segregation/condensation protein A [Spiroplasma clarkii]ARU92053.1 segregation and condensation protein A [Spiroplasma clarkii]ATX71383.1 segregation and condensation protein A [Spiroplasma clarkii]
MERWQELKLHNFTGPLDLLLYMIKEKQLSIFEVNLLELSNQYLAYINSLSQLDIEIASEYLIMAAYLIELKSKLLIPKLEVEIDSNYEADQREELLARLLEYHKIKEVTAFFKEQQLEGLKLYSKPKSVFKITKIDDDSLPLAPAHIDIDKFAQIFLKVIEKNRFKTMQTNTVTSVEISPEEVARDIQQYLEEHKIEKISLEDLIAEKEFSIRMLVATFLAILDLAAKGKIDIFQADDHVMVQNLLKEEITNGI